MQSAAHSTLPNAVASELTTRRGLTVSTKISLGFGIVLLLHISIAFLGHYGLTNARSDLVECDSLHRRVEQFSEIDRVVGALQRNVLLFAFTGYEGQESHANELQDRLTTLLVLASAAATDQEDREEIDAMQRHLTLHREIFDAVAVDRAKRRQILNDVLMELGPSFDSALQSMISEKTPASIVGNIRAAMRTVQLETMCFVNAPDSVHVRLAKQNLLELLDHLRELSAVAPDLEASIPVLFKIVSDYEAALIQMVQATRGYLHLVNVVLAGESEEFRRLASDARSRKSQLASDLTQKMSVESQRFQIASTAFSWITIALGMLAAWLIGRDVAPPLNAITSTFDGLTSGRPCAVIPGLQRRDELGRLAVAAQIFKDKAADTERLLRIAESSQSELNELNRRLEAQTKLAETMASEATAATLAKSEFLANMSHEIRTPMTAILGFAETLGENVEGDANLDAVDTIKRNGEHLLAIINDILDLSKVEAGKLTVESVPLCPAELVNDVISLVRVQADARGLFLTGGFQGEIPEVIQSDPTRLRQILINVVGNAIKFTHSGKVQVDCKYVSSLGKAMVQFDVIDTGIGMSEEEVSRLFQPFSQGDASTTRQFGGTGLGLVISKRFAILLGGNLTLVESRVGHGSHFRITVAAGALENVRMTKPGADWTSKLHESVKATALSRLEGLRILLAEDGPDNQRLLSFVLNKAGAQVTVVENGQLALDAAMEALRADNAFDCILMDMQMPVMGGYEATRRLRKAGYSGAIIALTAHVMDGDKAKCIGAGCDDYVTKPIDRAILINRVDHWGRRPSDTFAAGELPALA